MNQVQELAIGSISVCAFYHLISLSDGSESQSSELENFKTELKQLCVDNEIKGTILVANDGVNGTIAGDYSKIQVVLSYLCKKLGVTELFEYKYNNCDFVPFGKMKVLIRNEVVAMRSDSELDYDLKPEDADNDSWDEMIEDDETQVIDTRNDYEFKIGTFKKAINPDTTNFREFKDYLQQAVQEGKLDKNKKTAIFCTGGIRCEKAGIYMKNLGFTKVYQLKGGILRYLEKTKNFKKNWLGDCFVFDDRVTVDDNLKPGNLRCMHCLKQIETVDEKRSVTKGRVVCSECKKKKDLIN
jgi:UPF0176 protein